MKQQNAKGHAAAYRLLWGARQQEICQAKPDMPAEALQSMCTGRSCMALTRLNVMYAFCLTGYCHLPNASYQADPGPGYIEAKRHHVGNSSHTNANA